MTAPKLSPKMTELVAQLRAGTHRVYVQPMETRQDLLLAFRVDQDGRESNGRRLSPTAWALVERGILVPSTEHPRRMVLADQ